jgi:uncharacterized delta-60 repeat protein
MFTPFAFIIDPSFYNPPTPIVPALQYLLIGGAFNAYNIPVTSATANRILKLTSTGDADPSFNMGAGFSTGLPEFIVPQTDGKYLMGGVITGTYSGSTINGSNLIRVNQNGTYDTTFSPGTIAGTPQSAVINPDNSSVITGTMILQSGSVTRGIIKLNPSGSIDTSFNVGLGFNNIAPFQITRQPDGKYIVVGTFTQYSSSFSLQIGRTNISGSPSIGPGNSFNPGIGFNSNVIGLAPQSDGKILAGGAFTLYSGSAVFRILRLNSNGAIDSTYNVGTTGLNGSLTSFSVQSDEKVLCTGIFTTFSGSAINRIVRINTNGTRDTTFNVGTGLNAGASTTAFQSDGKILLGGVTTLTYSGSTASPIFRINPNGTRDTTFNIGSGFSGGNVNKIIVQPDGKIIVGGNFTSYSGSSTNTTRIIRLNTSGSIDPTFVTGTGYNGEVIALALQSDGKIIVGGSFTTYSGSSQTRINRLNANGTQDATFVTGTGVFGTFVNPSHLSVESDDKIYLGSFFGTYNNITVNNFARINSNGSLDTTIQYQNINLTGFNNAVRTIFVSGSNIYYGGDFTSYRGQNNIVRINTDGTIDNTFVIGSGAANTVNVALLQPDGKIVLGGFAMQPYSGSLINNRVFRINSNGSVDTTFNIDGTGPDNAVLAMAAETNGKIVLVGTFLNLNAIPASRIVRINNSGSRDSDFNMGTGFNLMSPTVRESAVTVLPDNGIVCVGTFSSYSGSTAALRIIKIAPSGNIDTSFQTTATSPFGNIGNGFSNNPKTLIQSGSSILTAGRFNFYKVPFIQGGLMIDSNGAASSSFNIGVSTGINGFGGSVLTWVTQSDGKILAGGGFTAYSGSSINRIIRLNTDGTIDTTFNVGTGANGNIVDARVQNDGKVIIMGVLNTYSGSAVASNMTRLNTNGTIDTTYNLGAGFVFPQFVYHSALQSDGKLIAVGPFTQFSGSTANRIVRINTNGTRDTTFNVGAGFNGDVNAVILEPNGKIITVGNFTTYSGSAINRIIRLNTDGTRDTTFDMGTGLNVSGSALALQSNGNIVVGGNFTTYSGSSGNYIIRINPSGTFDSTFNANATSSITPSSGTPNSLKIDNNGSIYWGNSFTTFSGSFIPNGIVKLNSSGAVDETFNAAFPNFVNDTGKGANSTVNAILLI